MKNAPVFLLFLLALSISVFAHAQNSVTALEKLNSYLPAAAQEGNLYAGTTTTGQKCRVQAAYGVNTYFVSIDFEDKSPSLTYHLMIQPSRFEATTIIGQREIPNHAIEYASRWTRTSAGSSPTAGLGAKQVMDENILVLKDQTAVRMVTLNAKSCVNLRLIHVPAPSTSPLPPQQWTNWKTAP